MKLIIIDDHDGQIEIIRRLVDMIRAYHPHLIPYYFENAEDAYVEIKENNISLIVCDYDLGKIRKWNGLDLAKVIKQSHSEKNWPFLLVSGSDMKAEAYAAGVYFLSKDDFANQFVERCVNIINRSMVNTGLQAMGEKLDTHIESSDVKHTLIMDELKKINENTSKIATQRIWESFCAFFPKPIKALLGVK